MKQVFKVVLLAVILICYMTMGNVSFAQVNYQQQYTNAKALYKEGKYNLAMESFKPLVAYDKNNPFPEYASYYYAISAYHQGYKSVAKDMLTQVKQLYPTWDQLDEVNLWLAKIHFDSQEYFQGMNQLSAIKNPKLQKEVNLIKKNGLAGLTDVSALRRMHQEYPKDAVVGERLAKELSKTVDTREERELLDKLLATFKLKKSDFIEETPPTVHKEVYSVSVMFPFQVTTLEPNLSRKRNQYVLDLYEGIKLAVDTLAKQGVKISLRAYDTDRNPARIKALLERDELKTSDLIIGPLFQEENKIIQDFSRANKINLFNPVSNNFDLVRDNPYGFLFQPALETLGEQSAKFLDAYQINNKKCMVFFGDTRRDSVLAMSFIQAATETRLKIIQVERFTKESSTRILRILASPTEYDEFKYPKQFTLPKDSLGCIFVASDDPVIYSKITSSVTTRGDKVTIVGSENWLDQTSDYEKLSALGVVMFASNYTPYNNPAYIAFQKKFAKVHGRVTSTMPYTDYVKIGYDFMLFAGNMLNQHGVYFQDALNRNEIKGYLTEGYNFQFSRDNRHVPFIRFKEGELVLVSPSQ
ncbi:MAG: ABC transporter substrate-binding protein [Cyclobacteriaceae bacterium]|nr:ABC transporter substrate-binding protein [Cyclobacteriaceae bacterium]UYN86007.1 MAG: ABC transporter substrate-binding protein [Cyclobacteriaceae bacterium]